VRKCLEEDAAGRRKHHGESFLTWSREILSILMHEKLAKVGFEADEVASLY